MTPDEGLARLVDRAPVILGGLLLLAGIALWFLLTERDPAKALQARCKKLNEPARVVRLPPGSRAEERFKFYVAAPDRVQLSDGSWMFCHGRLKVAPNLLLPPPE